MSISSAATDGDEPPLAPVCAAHMRRIEQGEPWLWLPGRQLKGVGSDMSEGCILMGDELAGYGLVVDANIRMSNSQVFSPDLADGVETTTLAIDGRVFGANQHVSIELALAPETVQRLKEALRFFRA
ncbi:MAG: hypothetical protein M3228_08840 [Actinomycetota bacterium]|nr:hypothetical protein [Actinomycetota bacterium]